MSKQLIALVIFLALCFGAAAIGGLITAKSVNTWYTTINKPVWTPPNWLFGPVWSLLYLMMAISGWLVWRNGGWEQNSFIMILFIAQLVLNVGWSGLFFGLRLPGWAVLELLVLWGMILWYTLASIKVVPLAGILFIPYLLWVTFAGALNIAVWRLN